jgi:hypothetical protein
MGNHSYQHKIEVHGAEKTDIIDNTIDAFLSANSPQYPLMSYVHYRRQVQNGGSEFRRLNIPWLTNVLCDKFRQLREECEFYTVCRFAITDQIFNIGTPIPRSDCIALDSRSHKEPISIELCPPSRQAILSYTCCRHRRHSALILIFCASHEKYLYSEREHGAHGVLLSTNYTAVGNLVVKQLEAHDDENLRRITGYLLRLSEKSSLSPTVAKSPGKEVKVCIHLIVTRDKGSVLAKGLNQNLPISSLISCLLCQYPILMFKYSSHQKQLRE